MYAAQDLFSPVTGATGPCDARNVAKGVENPALTAYVRFEIIGDRKDVTAIAKELDLTKQWVINVREGHRGVGGSSMRKLADKYFGGSLDKLWHRAERYAKEHPEQIAWVMADAATDRRERAIALVYEDTGTPPEVLAQWAAKIDLAQKASTLDWVRALEAAAEPEDRPRPVERPTPRGEPAGRGRRKAERDST